MENKYEEALDFLMSYPRVIEENGSVSVEKLKEAHKTLQELIDKTTICGLSLDEAIPVIEMYKQLKQTTNQLEPITDLMMGMKGQFYINGKSIQQILDLHDIDYVVIAKQSQDLQKLEKALDKACEIIANVRLSFSIYKDNKDDWKEYLLSEVQNGK